ncbi:MAG: alpha-ketoglutarate-dependent dioxygenase AlkB, partial [Cytophagales bacterium]|nr:alpha-ketoglutarate-dependent dioxygenase AlkB [Cytophagales bacterium]
LPARLYSDGAKPPPLPESLIKLAVEALEAAQKVPGGEGLPRFAPDVCIVNFYEKQGSLGMHQDKDEQPETLQLGLPVVSLSVGDSAWFAYGWSRGDASGRVLLQSGDLLVFGGESRMIFHGIDSVESGTGPEEFPGGVRMRSGRLNLTFR